MKSTIDFLNEAKVALGEISDYRLAKILGVQQSTMSRYRTSERIIDDYAAAQIAKILNVDEMIVISAANAEREKTEERREYWSNKYKELGGVAASVILAMSLTAVTPSPAHAEQASNSAEAVYIMLN